MKYEWLTHMLGRPAVYWLYYDNKLVYVGKSTNLFSRLGNHARRSAKLRGQTAWILGDSGVKFNRVMVWWCTIEELHALELQHIRAYRPPGNIAGVSEIDELTHLELLQSKIMTDETPLKWRRRLNGRDQMSQGLPQFRHQKATNPAQHIGDGARAV